MPRKDKDAYREYMREWYARPENKKRVIAKVKARKHNEYAGVCERCGGPTIGYGPGKAARFCNKPGCVSAQRRHRKQEVLVERCFSCVSGPAARWQDKRYGKGMRVHEIVPGGRKCMVCGAVKPA